VKDLEGKISQDVLEFLNLTDKMCYQDKLEMLTLLIKKYALLNKSDVMLNKKDLQDIISKAKQNFTEMPMPVHIEGSDRPVHQLDLPNLCVIEATIALLNKNDCFKKIPKFNYKRQ
jgi:hypothetical protein